MARFVDLLIADIRHETKDCVSIALSVPDGLREKFSFRAGQHLIIAHQDLRRTYSICTSPASGELRIAVKHLEGGEFSSKAQSFALGQSLTVMPPGGRFLIPDDDQSQHHYLFVAAGSGITPIIAMIRDVLEREPASAVILLYGNRNPETVIFKNDLENLKNSHLGRLAVHHVFSGGAGQEGYLSGRIDRALINKITPAIVDPTLIDGAFLCGPGDLVEQVRSALGDQGLEPTRIKSELFTATGHRPRTAVKPPDQPEASLSLLIDGTAREIDWQAGDRSILDAGVRAGLDLPFACRGGVCATCRARITSGEASMEVNYALEPWEVEQGFVLTCQARPTTKQLSVDFDAV